MSDSVDILSNVCMTDFLLLFRLDIIDFKFQFCIQGLCSLHHIAVSHSHSTINRWGHRRQCSKGMHKNRVMNDKNIFEISPLFFLWQKYRVGKSKIARYLPVYSEFSPKHFFHKIMEKGNFFLKKWFVVYYPIFMHTLA